MVDTNVDLDLVTPRSAMFADWGILHPVNAWSGASDYIRVIARWRSDGVLVQEGWNDGEPATVFARTRGADNLWSSWELVDMSGGGSVADTGSSYVRNTSEFADGPATETFPDWFKVAFTASVDSPGNNIVDLAGDDLLIRSNTTGVHAVEISASVDTIAFAGNSIIFGYSFDGAAPTEVGRIRLAVLMPAPVEQRFLVDLGNHANQTMSFFLSCDAGRSYTWALGKVTFSLMMA